MKVIRLSGGQDVTGIGSRRSNQRGGVFPFPATIIPIRSSSATR